MGTPRPRVEIRAGKGGVRFQVYAQPRASRSEVVGTHGSAIKVRLAAPPVEGAANRELVTFLARRLSVSKSAVHLLRGERGRRKLVEVEGVSERDVQALVTS